MFQLITDALNWVSQNPKIVAAIVGAAAALSLLLETFLLKLRNKFTAFAQKPVFKKVAFTLLHLTTLLSTGATYWLANVPAHDLPAIYAGISIAAEFWHRFVVSGLFSRFIVPFLEWQSGQKVSQPTETVAPAALPELE